MNTFLADILAQPAALELVLADLAGQNRPSLERAAGLVKSAQRIVLTSMGSAYYSLFPMAYALSRLHPNIHLVETSGTLAKNASLVIHDVAPYDGFNCTKAYTSLGLVGLMICSVFEKKLTPALEASLRYTFTWMEEHKQRLWDEVS